MKSSIFLICFLSSNQADLIISNRLSFISSYPHIENRNKPPTPGFEVARFGSGETVHIQASWIIHFHYFPRIPYFQSEHFFVHHSEASKGEGQGKGISNPNNEPNSKKEFIFQKRNYKGQPLLQCNCMKDNIGITARLNWNLFYFATFIGIFVMACWYIFVRFF